jgi:hypothetical protein
MGFSFVGLALGFKFGMQVGDIQDRLVFGFLKAALAVSIDGFDVMLGLIPCFLEAAVAVVLDGSEVNVEVAKHGDPVLFV